MTFQHVLDEASSNIGVGRRLRGAVAQHHIIHHRERGHQLGPGTLREQWMRRIGYFHHQQPPGFPLLAESAYMSRKQRIEGARDPTCGTVLHPLVQFMERDYFRSCIQKQSLTVTCPPHPGLVKPGFPFFEVFPSASPADPSVLIFSIRMLCATCLALLASILPTATPRFLKLEGYE